MSEDKSKLIVTGNEGDAKPRDEKDEDSDYPHRRFRRTYKLPKNVEINKLVGFMTSISQLVIEIPIREEDKQQVSAVKKGTTLFPRIVDCENNSKFVVIDMLVPEDLDPTKIKVTCKDRDVIVQAENKQENSDHFSLLLQALHIAREY